MSFWTSQDWSVGLDFDFVINKEPELSVHWILPEPIPSLNFNKMAGVKVLVNLL